MVIIYISMISAIIHAGEDVLCPRMATRRESNSASPSESHKINIFAYFDYFSDEY